MTNKNDAISKKITNKKVSADGVTSAMKLVVRIRNIQKLSGLWIWDKNKHAYMMNKHSDVIWCWHQWFPVPYSENYNSLYLANLSSRADVFIYLHTCGAEIYDNFFTRDLHILRYCIEIGCIQNDHYLKSYLQCMKQKNTNRRYHQLISRFAPKHVPREIWKCKKK